MVLLFKSIPIRGVVQISRVMDKYFLGGTDLVLQKVSVSSPTNACLQGTCNTYMALLSTNKAVHSGFETQRRRHQKSKTEISVAPEKGLYVL